MYLYPMDSTILLVIPVLVLSLWAQMRVSSTFKKYSSVSASRGVTADAVARSLLNAHGLSDVSVRRVAGDLTDHYDPRDRSLSLSDSVGGSGSIAAIGVAAHEVGHAIQHREGYFALGFRNALVPVANICSQGAPFIFLLGLLLSRGGLVFVGIAMFCGVIAFHLITLPVEFNASSRALKLLGETDTLSPTEIQDAKKVLDAAAWTYIAATLMALAQLVRMILIARASGRDRSR